MSGLSPEARDRLAAAVKAAGGQSEIARRLGISRQNLNNVLRSGKGIGASRLAAIAAEAGVSVDYILSGDEPTAEVDIVNLPIVEIEASAGAGRAGAIRPAVVDHMPFPAAYARTLGQVGALRLVTARGDSQEPDIRDGDLIMYEEGTPYRAEGMYVIVLDGDLMVKRLQRGAAGFRILSINPAYGPIEIPAPEVDARLTVLGRVVWSGKQW
jgi:phage repressor protein C with HTH and peptisase S24 domain